MHITDRHHHYSVIRRTQVKARRYCTPRRWVVPLGLIRTTCNYVRHSRRCYKAIVGRSVPFSREVQSHSRFTNIVAKHSVINAVYSSTI